MIVRWAAHIDVGYCPLGHRVTGTELMNFSNIQRNVGAFADSSILMKELGTPLPKSRALTTYEEHMGDRFTAPADELIKLRNAGLLTDAEARLIVVDMFPQIKRLEDARRMVEDADKA